MQARFRRADRDTESGCDLGKLEVEVVVEHDHGPMRGIQAAEATFELVAIVGDGFTVAGGRGVEPRDLDVEPVSAEPPCFVDAGSNEETVQPGVDAIGIAQRGQITPGSDERVLDGVLCLFRIPRG